MCMYVCMYVVPYVCGEEEGAGGRLREKGKEGS